MFTDEVLILMAIEEAGEPGTKPVKHLEEIMGKRSDSLCASLVGRGHLTENIRKGYQLTRKGRETILREAILLVSCADRTRAKSRMERLERLHTEISQQIEKLEKETVNIFS